MAGGDAGACSPRDVRLNAGLLSGSPLALPSVLETGGVCDMESGTAGSANNNGADGLGSPADAAVWRRRSM